MEEKAIAECRLPYGMHTGIERRPSESFLSQGVRSTTKFTLWEDHPGCSVRDRLGKVNNQEGCPSGPQEA